MGLRWLQLIGADMAIGSLLGGNPFGPAIVAADDPDRTSAPLSEGVSEVRAGTAIGAIVMTGAVIAAPSCRPATRTFRGFGGTGPLLPVDCPMTACVFFLVRE